MTKLKSGFIEWECPSNIALIKYWGKKPGQLPMNPSISITLSKSLTNFKTAYSFNPDGKSALEFLFEEKPNPSFESKIADYLTRISTIMPILRHVRLKIDSVNTFPHSAGIASSASSFGALALTLCSIEDEINSSESDKDTFFNKASNLARLGSGSACRSVYGGYVIWGHRDEIPGSGDEAGFPLKDINPEFRFLMDSILVVSPGTKAVSSSKGHELMNNNPFAASRSLQAQNNIRKLLTALKAGSMDDFFNLIENEALTLHALMMTSSPGYILMLPGTLEIINKIRKFRADTGLAVGFSLDAGPNVHVIYPGSVETDVRKFIKETLTEFCDREMIIHDKIGSGPVRKH